MSTKLNIQFANSAAYQLILMGSDVCPALKSSDTINMASRPDGVDGETFVIGWTCELPETMSYAAAQFSMSEKVARGIAGAMTGYFAQKDGADPLAPWREMHGRLDVLFASYISEHPDQGEFLDMPFRQLLEWSAMKAGVGA